MSQSIESLAVSLLIANKESINYAKIFGPEKRGLVLGETHTVKTIKQEIINNLGLLKESGATHFCMEFLRYSDQDVLNRYFSSGDNDREVRDLFIEPGQWLPGGQDLYFGIVSQAKAIGLPIIGLNNGNLPACIFIQPDGTRSMTRDAFMASEVLKLLSSNHCARPVLFVGSQHAALIEDTMAMKIQSEGFNIISASFTGGIDESMFSRTLRLFTGRPNPDRKVEEAASVAECANKAFMIPYHPVFDYQYNPLHGNRFNWYIHLPGNS